MNEKHVVQIASGQRLAAGYIGEGRFWFPSELRKDGQPDARKPGHVHAPSWSKYNGYRNGNYAALDEARELQAGAIRAEIKQISNALADANDRLFALYAGPKPASQGVA